MIYECVSGFPPSRFPEVPTNLMKEAEENLFVRLNRIVLKACATDPRQRYRSAEELKESILNAMKGIVAT